MRQSTGPPLHDLSRKHETESRETSSVTLGAKLCHARNRGEKESEREQVSGSSHEQVVCRLCRDDFEPKNF